ncbi:MAG: ABC transporter ATP-binding protein [Pseudodesulfovibrio sp.]|uniref:ABC transporter related protein n=1 Tax=Pseudodesulfovibrio aespoeensis (strain ATCC 700646 / DSM 10631 / Aspo-2) TaxID=643562 RepID=E6VTI0_PSEA9|nr:MULTISPECIES: ABC transporter ATP-binding protein [Pseudodesulfovibrio]MBU4192783.1 ABC transporter ATP-binding protein [Pseudomonadota bacterium]ADU62157.1 ABC transporter related protein [Pseudodesulfovibrio aespoeensis Aspo-2]MBU4380002.1 ABC transporter ATP-binding protein [Pseudomonadota bacterium]MBU4474911.1 ABC transporter ATP-binding protein [Pseudomonadota bacterium]MBU4514908.1 ABC transporter ATP-binding protein [Pseudomonadota bacterium]
MNKPKLELVSLCKEYDNGSVIAVEDIDLRVEAGETVALLGSSGCGKSTTLNMIVGLESPTSGDIQIDGKSVVSVPPGRRNVGLVFQDYAVFTSMTVRKNLAFGLEVRGKYVLEINRAVEEVAELLGMSDKLEARARDLGGSELQRVAIGRTLVTKPSILLLDEPLSNLETSARLAMRRELRRLQSEIGLTIIYVTHDQVEALSLADRIAVMNAGRILQVEKASTICAMPGHTFVAGFLGSPPMNLIRGKFEARGGEVFFRRGDFSLALGAGATVPEGYFTLGMRAESIRLASGADARFTGRVSLLEPRGSEAVLTVDVGRETLKVVVPPHARLAVGEVVGLAVDRESLHFFDGDNNRATSLELAGRIF